MSWEPAGWDAAAFREAFRRDRELPTPLPIFRERSLTPPLPSEESGSRIRTGRRDPLRIMGGPYQDPQEMTEPIVVLQTTSDQCQSPLFRLPPELRQEIWKMSLGNNVIHILHKHQRLGHVKCKFTLVEKWGMGEHLCWNTKFLRKNRNNLAPQICPFSKDRQGYLERLLWFFSKNRQNYSEGLLGLLVSCRKIYSEAIDFLYGANTFDFRDLFTIFDLSSTLLRKRFNTITSLQVSWHLFPVPIYGNSIGSNCVGVPGDRETWEETWKLVGSMEGLKILRVDIVTWDCGVGGFDSQLKLLRAMSVVQQTDEFEVRIPWPMGRFMTYLSGMKIELPFTLERATEEEFRARSNHSRP